jgi:hypothetical protein
VIGIDPLYFLDEMSQDEIVKVMEYRSKSDTDRIKGTWEQVRLLSYYTVASFNGTKTMKKPTDLFLLPWEKSDKPKGRRLTEAEALKKAEDNRRNRALLHG